MFNVPKYADMHTKTGEQKAAAHQSVIKSPALDFVQTMNEAFTDRSIKTLRILRYLYPGHFEKEPPGSVVHYEGDSEH